MCYNKYIPINGGRKYVRLFILFFAYRNCTTCLPTNWKNIEYIFSENESVPYFIKLNEITHYIFLKIAQSPRAKKVMRDDYYKYDKSEEED